MIRLVRTELTRYRSRRAIALLILLAALLAALVAAKSAWDTRPPTPQEIATASAQAGIQADRADIKADLDKCLANPERYLGGNTTAQECRDSLVPAATSYLPRAPLDLAGTLNGNGIGVTLLVIGLVIIAGATFAGADWASGSMLTQLLHEPRRLRLWSAKAIAVTIGGGLVALVTIGGFWLALYLVSTSRDLTPSDQVLGDIGWNILRAVVLAMGAGLGSYALTMVFRNTVGTLGLLFAYGVGGELLMTVVPVDGAARWSLGTNLVGWLEKSLHYFDPTSPCARLGDCSALERMSHLESGGYLLTLLVLACTVSMVVFKRRDA